MSLIGAILLGGTDFVPDVRLMPDDFYSHTHQEAWAVILNMHRSGQAIDIILFEDALVRAGHDRRPAYWADCIALCPTPFHAPDYARSVKDYSNRRQVIAEAGRKAGEAWKGKVSKSPFYDQADVGIDDLL